MNWQKKIKKNNRGFTIMELIVTIAVFAIIATAMLACFAVLTKSVKTAREKDTIASLAVNYLEAVRNMPYSQIGTISGSPAGLLPGQLNAIIQTIPPYTYSVYYKVTNIHDPADTSVGNTDYKQVKMTILNNTTKKTTDFYTTVSPKGLVTDPNTGALQVNVIDSQGQPLTGANVRITYPTTTPTIILPDVSDIYGQVTEIGLPWAINNYRVVASMPGYSTDTTISITGANPNPVHPDATVATGTVTQLTLSIDQLANLTIKTLNAACSGLNGINLNISGNKLIGSLPDIKKFDNDYSSASGQVALNNLEWDTYTPVLLTGQSVIVYGTSPIQKIDVLPGTTQTFTMVLGPNATANSLLVIVKDAATASALESATITLTGPSSYNQTLYSGGSVWVQNNWNGGGGLTTWSAGTPNRYFVDNGNVNVATAGTLQLKKVGSNYVTATGTLESATFDTGTSLSNYTILSWKPTSQSSGTSLLFQVAANNDNATWNYVGPNGTSSTYFTTPGSDMGSILDNKRYFRYKAFLKTTNTSRTPTLTSVSSNYISGCVTPGQVIFPDLVAGSYSLSVSYPGDTTQNISSLNVTGNQTLEVLMSP